MKDEKEQAELEAILEEASKHKPASKGKASAKVELHYVQQNMLNFTKRQPEMAARVKSVLQDNHLDNEHLEAVLNRDLPPELNHFIRWLLKIPFAERTEWQR